MPAKSARAARRPGGDPEPSPTGETALADRLHSAAIHLLRRLRREDDAAGLPAPQLSALSVIVFGGPITLGALAAAEQVRPPTITKLVAALEEAGLVSRAADAADRRVTRVSATARGARLLQDGRRRRVATLEASLGGLPRAEREQLARAMPILEKIVRGARSSRGVRNENSIMTDTPSCAGLVSEHSCTLATSGWQIPASLTLPSRPADARLPSAILLVPGSLFSDVNGDYPAWHSYPHVYGHLARQLSARGHAVYRFAKLGPGTGSVAVDAEASAVVKTWDGRLAIATAALDAMRAELEARGVTVARTIAAGHSEGAVVVSRLGTSERASDLDGVVLLSGPSVGILEIMREQMRSSAPPDQREEASRRLDSAIEHLRRGTPIPPELSDAGGMGAAALASMPPDGQRYMRECDATDPKALAAQMVQSVLVVQGGNDSSVPAHHGEALRDVLRARSSGRTDYLFVPDATHMYKQVPAELPPMEAFGYPGETDVRVADGIDRWNRGLA